MAEYVTVSFRMLKKDHAALKQSAIDSQRDVTKQLNFLVKQHLDAQKQSK